MITFPELPGIEINVFMLVLLGFAIGMVGGFIAVGGGFVMTPALIVLGFLANFAMGTSISYIAGTSIMAAMRHRQLGNLDPKLGFFMTVGMLPGVEAGLRMLNSIRNLGMADPVVLSASIVMLIIVGTYAFWETGKRRAQLAGTLNKDERGPHGAKSLPMSRKFQSIKIPPVIHFAKSRVTMPLWIVLGIGLFTDALDGFMGLLPGDLSWCRP